jgi:membrane-associated protease RseP (regulator of RpoE activity)
VRDPLEAVDIDKRRALTYVMLVLAFGAVLAVARPDVFGTIAVILAFFVMIMLHEFGHFVMAKRAGMKVTEFFVGFGPRLWSVKKGETEYGLKAIPAGGYCRIIGMTNLEEVAPEDEPRAYRSKRFLPKLGVACAGSAMHFLIALVLIFCVLAFAGDWFSDPHATTTVHEVSAKSPAAQALVHPGDRILSVAGTPIHTWEGAVKAIQARPGETVAIVVARNVHGVGQHVSIAVHLASHSPNADPKVNVGYAGITPVGNIVRPGALASLALAPWREVQLGGSSIAALGHIFSPSGVHGYLENFQKSPPKSAQQDRPVSVVGFGRLAHQAVAAGWVQTFLLLILINVFIGIFNLVPLLPFDGGHAAIAIYEWIASAVRRRRVQVDVAKLMPVTLLVLAVLAFLFLSTLFLDVKSPIANPF